jgi:hypothetical protein
MVTIEFNKFEKMSLFEDKTNDREMDELRDAIIDLYLNVKIRSNKEVSLVV